MPLKINQIVLGSHNKKKVAELQTALEPLGIACSSLEPFPTAIEVEETGETFFENARLKAVQQAVHLGEWTIGEDSGLCVPALKGAPGVYSARYAGESATDEQNNQKLLNELSEMTGQKRSAYYVCTMVLSDPSGQVHVECEGRCHGRIISEYRGSGGFGYDPLFEIPEYHRTFAELGGTVKTVLSHRGRAVRTFIDKLQTLELASHAGA